MKSLFLFLPLIGLLSCRDKEEIPTDASARISGKYIVQSYVINEGTLYTSQGINKIGLSEFYILIERKNADSVRIGQIYKRTGDIGTLTFIKDVAVKEMNGSFQLITTTSPLYVSTITDGVLFERTAFDGLGVVLLPPAYSLKPPIDPVLTGVFITAQKL